jgi:hypothetical protein
VTTQPLSSSFLLYQFLQMFTGFLFTDTSPIEFPPQAGRWPMGEVAAIESSISSTNLRQLTLLETESNLYDKGPSSFKNRDNFRKREAQFRNTVTS